MPLSLLYATIGIASTGGLAAVAVRARALTARAGLVAFAFGGAIVVLGGFPYLALLVLFVGASVLATRYRFEEKRRRNVQEGSEGERGVSNVVAHILVPTGLVVGAWLLPGEVSVPALSVLFTAALAFGAADTFASEFGVLAGAARSILTARPVAPGTNGGVSALGELWALAGALTTAIVSVGLLVGFRVPYGSPGLLLAVASSAGFLGCQLDSVLGELLENRGLLTKGSTNLLAMFGAVVIAGGLLAGFGGWG